MSAAPPRRAPAPRASWSALLLPLLLGCAAPWTAGAGPMVVPPAPAASAAKGAARVERDPHVLRKPVDQALEVGQAAVRQRLGERAAPRVAILVLNADEQPFQSSSTAITAVNLASGQVTSTTVTSASPLPGLTGAGWKEEPSHALQESLLAAGLRVIDLPVAQWKADPSTVPAELLFELRAVQSDPLPELELRVIRMGSGEVLSVARAPVAPLSDRGDAAALAARQALGRVYVELATRL